MKTILLFVFLTIPYLTFFSQHRTSYTSNGDPQSEIIDPDNMKQGTWSYYDYMGSNIRLETYKDNVLLTRESFTSISKVNTIEYREIPMNTVFLSEIKKIEPTCSGEFLINEDGEILTIHFYNEIEPKHQKMIKEKILNSYQSNFTNVIITF
jgi:hypothetical protein